MEDGSVTNLASISGHSLPNLPFEQMAKLLTQRMQVEQRLSDNQVKKLEHAASITSNGLSAIQILVTEVVGYYKQQSVNELELARIESDRVVELERAAVHKELLQDYLEKAFAERRLVLDTFIRGLDQGLATGDTKLVEALAAQLVEVVRTPVLAKIAEASSALASGGTINLGGKRA